MHVLTYSNLYIAYKYLITLACTQVSCERVFSKLKILKSRLRASLGEELLEALLLMNLEPEISFKIDPEIIIFRLASKGNVYKKLLIG